MLRSFAGISDSRPKLFLVVLAMVLLLIYVENVFCVGRRIAGLDYPSQVERLARGKKFLEEMIGVPVTTFVPPWNEYDRNTLRALEETDFTTLSAGIYGEAAEELKIRFLPATCSLINLRDAVDAARNASDEQPLIVVLFHLYDFREIDENLGSTSFQELKDLLRKCF